ncbi:ATP synthase F1 subcomplex delta subunit [Actinomadura pelletieri DSM 43383]|uniref:ATP synthase subunit delta n=1 Tax=Actinomadura pelletieri DSM 43383 TaxID=1120940 RepID=A0A495QTB8_9ACTN|nr:F0F1 ATP synthase subunit delta [Actinomadura pelletieri]RKS76762.1 ATP synthase F1 subcomplex delta subunit [Actinomadura pelletieri DSM 43383]
MTITGAVSRASLAEARERFEAVVPSADLARLGGDLFSVLHLFDNEHGLRRAVSDPARDGADKAQLVQILLEGKVSSAALGLVADVVRLRWSKPSELADALETLAVTAEAARAEADGRIDDLEDELFRFSRVVEGEAELRGALAGPGLPDERRLGLVEALLDGKVTASTLTLVTELVLRPRGRSLEGGLAEYGRIVAQRRQRLVALVRTPAELPEAQRTRLAAVLAAAYGHEVHLNIEIDPTVIGGLSIQLGDEIIDGTIAGRLDDVRRRLGTG